MRDNLSASMDNDDDAETDLRKFISTQVESGDHSRPLLETSFPWFR